MWKDSTKSPVKTTNKSTTTVESINTTRVFGVLVLPSRPQSCRIPHSLFPTCTVRAPLRVTSLQIGVLDLATPLRLKRFPSRVVFPRPSFLGGGCRVSWLTVAPQRRLQNDMNVCSKLLLYRFRLVERYRSHDVSNVLFALCHHVCKNSSLVGLVSGLACPYC